MNTSDYLLEKANKNALVFITNDMHVSYGLLQSMSVQLIEELQKNYIQPGDRVAIWGVNSPYWAAAYLAIMKIGAVAVPISTFISMEDFKRNMEFAGCKFLLVDKLLFYRNLENSHEYPSFILDDELLNVEQGDWPETDGNFDFDRDAAFMFTSGTTATPRAVRITHRNIQANTDSIIDYLALDSDERMMVVLPFFYCFGTSLLHTHLRVGATLVLAKSFVFPETVLDLMETSRSTGFAGVPTNYQTLLRNSTFTRRKLPHLRKLQQAGGKLHDTLIQELVDSHPQAKVFVMYGQTEATARLSYLPPELLSTKLGSIGKGIPGVTLSVAREEDGQAVKPGEVGEILAEGDNISPGYYMDPEATKEKFKNGILYTGDLATVDEEGFIYIVDRKSDFIKSYGNRISSYEIETCVLQIPEVVAAAAIGVPDERAGEKIRVFVILSSKSAVNAENIMEHCRKHLSRYMWPEDIVITKSFPVNAHGKVIKSELRKIGTS